MLQCFWVNEEGQSKQGLVVWCLSAVHSACWVCLQTMAQRGRGALQSHSLLLMISLFVLCSLQSHSSYLDVRQCGSSQDASREGVSLSSHSSRRSSHTTLSDSTCRCWGSPGYRQWAGGQSSLQNTGVWLEVTKSGVGGESSALEPTYRAMTSHRAEQTTATSCLLPLNPPPV